MDADSKSIFTSKTVIGVVLLFVSMLTQRFGIHIPADDAGLINDLGTCIGLIMSIVGRIVASQPLHLVAPAAGAGPSQGGFARMVPLVMMAIISAVFCLALTGCASMSGGTSSTKPSVVVFELEGDFAAALQVAVAYEALPRCGPSVSAVCSKADIVVKLDAAASTAYTALSSAEGLVRAAGSNAQGSGVDAAIQAAQIAVAAVLSMTQSIAITAPPAPAAAPSAPPPSGTLSAVPSSSSI